MSNVFTEHIRAKVVFDPRDLTKKHEQHSDWKKHVIAFIDEPDFCEYYMWFLKKRYNLYLVKPIRGVHFTIINDKVQDKAKYKESKRLYDGIIVDIDYSLDIRTDGKYWWFKAWSNDGVAIRQSCGLGKGFWGSHITVGRAEGREYEQAHSQYIHSLIKLSNEFK